MIILQSVVASLLPLTMALVSLAYQSLAGSVQQEVTVSNRHPLISYHGRWDALHGTWWCVLDIIYPSITGRKTLLCSIQGWLWHQIEREKAGFSEVKPRNPHNFTSHLCRRLRQLWSLCHRQHLGRIQHYSPGRRFV